MTRRSTSVNRRSTSVNWRPRNSTSRWYSADVMVHVYLRSRPHSSVVRRWTVRLAVSRGAKGLGSRMRNGGHRHPLAHRRALLPAEPGERKPPVRIEAERRDNVAEPRGGGPLPFDPGHLASREELPHHERAPLDGRHEEPRRVHRQHRTARRGEPVSPRLEEVAPRARVAAVEANLGERGREPDDL